MSQAELATRRTALTADAFAARAAERLRPTPPGPLDRKANPRGDHDLNPDVLGALLDGAPRLAAVLMPVVAHPDGLSVLFTERSANLRVHSGQIAFPGGKIDPDDASPLAAALREAHEEIGLDPEVVTPLGYLDAYLSGTGFLVVPVVGLVRPPLALVPNPDEVAAVFEVPLATLMDPARYEIRSREWRGVERRFYAIPVGARTIWGVTAGIVHSFHERFRDP